jgi:WD40 repeat protein
LIRIWDLATGKLLHTLEGHGGPVTALAFAANGKTLASGSADKEVRLWNAQEGKLEHTITSHTNTVTTFSWSSRSLATGASDNQVLLVNPLTGAVQKQLNIFHPLLSVAWSADGKGLATGTTDLSAIVWDPGSGTAIKRYDRPGSPRTVTAVAFSPTQPILAAGRGNHTLQLWDLRTDKAAVDVKTMAPVHTVAWTSDGRTVVAGTTDRTVRSWEAASGALISTLVGSGPRITTISGEGHYRVLPTDADPDIVYVVQTFGGQETLSPADFLMKYRFKNQPIQAKFPGG